MTKFLTIALMTALTVTAEVHGQTAPSPQEVANIRGFTSPLIAAILRPSSNCLLPVLM